MVVLGQSGVLRDPIPGIAHFFTFWGFIIIQFGLLNLMLGAFNGSLPLLGDNHAFAILLDAFVIFVADRPAPLRLPPWHRAPQAIIQLLAWAVGWLYHPGSDPGGYRLAGPG